MTHTPTATFTLDGILQELKAIIAHSDPEQIKDITSHVQGILPVGGTAVNLQAGSDDEEKEIMMVFFVDQVTTPVQPPFFGGVARKIIASKPQWANWSAWAGYWHIPKTLQERISNGEPRSPHIAKGQIVTLAISSSTSNRNEKERSQAR